MTVSIIIINYNTFLVTCDCIASVLQYTKGVPYEIILVDNASPNDNPDDFLVKFPGINLIKSKENGGFAKGNNLGIAAASGDIILLLNSDTVLTEDPDGKLQHTARKFRSIKNELFDLLRPFLMVLPYKKRASIMLNQYFKGDYNTYSDWVSGAFMMFHRSLLDQMPDKKLDERFFMYGEDQLWCYQFYEHGYKSYYLSETTVIHIHNASTEPSKQLLLLKKFLALELKIMEYRKGKGLYYYIFSVILTFKEMLRYYIKIIVYKLFGHRIR